MKIILFDGTFKTTSFINRLAKGLSCDHDIYIMGFNEDLEFRIPDITYVPLGSNQSYWRLFIVSLTYAFQTKKLLNILKVFKNVLCRKKKNLQNQNLFIVLSKIQPEIVHLQWLSNISLFEEYLENNTYKFVLSQISGGCSIDFTSHETLKTLTNHY